MPIDFQRVQSVFAAVAELPPTERPAVLTRECGGDAELRRQVEALVRAHEDSSELPAAELQPTAAYLPAVELGQLFAGRYKLREKLGQGGMGVVFVADQTVPVQRRVALKVIRAGLDTHRLLARFEQERQALALMDHPNIAKVFDAGVDPAGRPYFAMELVKGLPLTKYCDDARLSLRQRLELFVPVCQAVQHAHQKGVIHRDLKPSNILVGLYDGRPVPKVIDFGVAKATGPPLTEQSIYTEVGSLIGTLEYMSPEQAELNNLDIDTRSDIYTLGVILYELLTGAVPFSRKELETAGLAEMLRVIKQVEPPRPSTKLSHSGMLPSIAAQRQMEPQKLTGLVRGELDWIVMKALEKDRGRRYETANGFAEDVRRYLAGEPVQAAPASAMYRLRKFVRRHRGPVTAAAAVVLVALAGLGVVLAVQRGSNRALAAKNAELDRANLNLRDAMRQKETANAALVEANGRVQARFELAREAIRSFKMGVEEEDALKEDRLRPLRDKLLGSARRFYDRLGELLRGQADAASKEVLAESYAALGALIARIGQKAEAREAYRKALAIRRELAAGAGAGASARLKLAQALNDVGWAEQQLGDHAGGLAAHEEAVTLAGPLAVGSGATIEARRALGMAHHGAGLALEATGADDRAMAAYRRAREVREPLAREAAAVPDDHQELAYTIGEIGGLLEKTGDLAGALAERRRYQELLRAQVAEHTDVPQYRRDLAVSHSLVGRLLEKTGDTAGALAAQRRAQELMRALAAEHPAESGYRSDLAVCHNAVGALLEWTGDLAGALAEQRRSQELMRALAAEHPAEPKYRRELALSHDWVGRLLAKTGDTAGALAEQRQYQERFRALAAEYPKILDYRLHLTLSHNRVAHLLEQTGDLAGALTEQRRYQELSRTLAAEHPDVLDYRGILAMSHKSVGVLLERTGDMAGALAEQRRSQELSRALAAEHPEVHDYRLGLALSHYWIGGLLEQSGDMAAALTEGRRYQELSRALAAEHPELPGYRVELAVSHIRVGELLTTAGRPAEALPELDSACSLLEALARTAPNVLEQRDLLARALNSAGAALRDLGRRGEARDRHARAIAIAEGLASANPQVLAYRARLADGLCRRAELELQASDARRAVELLEGLPTRTGLQWFWLACARATLSAAAGRGGPGSGPGPSAGEAPGLADRAMSDLRRAAAIGYRNPAQYRYEPALAPLRDRDDFRRLMMDLVMPADPFAHSP
jgi:tRNA A-37 threonylcarbamoyl transferase component Bud32